MRAEVRRFDSPDGDVASYVPEDPFDVRVFIQMVVGPRGDRGEESFNVVVCTPRSLERELRDRGHMIGRHLYLVELWDSARILADLQHAVESEEAPTWEELGTRIGRIGKWEFEDYKEFGTQ
jgi:hypothetical protein